jgi:iron transport multicopper oxidase
MRFIDAYTTMRFLHILQCFPLLLASVYAAIGPTADLHIANKFVQPDGFNRS